MPSYYSPLRFKRVIIYNGLKIGYPVAKEYTENGLHKPPAIKPFYDPNHGNSYNSATQLFNFSDGAVPHIGSETSALSIPVEVLADDLGADGSAALLSKLEKMRFIELDMTDGSTPNAYYGWVDDYRFLANGGPKGVVEVYWHIDYYLTFLGTASYGAGRLLRGPVDYARPDSTPPRLWEYHDRTEIKDTYKWAIMQRTVTNNGRTYLVTDYFPVGGSLTVGGNAVYCPTLQELFSGYLEELMEITSGSIAGLWLSPIQPYNYTAGDIKTNSGTTCAWLEYDMRSAPGVTPKETVVITLQDAVCTDDLVKYMIVDPYGTVFGTLPWGLYYDKIYAALDIGPVSAYLDLYFGLAADESDPTKFHTQEGRLFSVPLMQIPVTDNAWKEYNYSGQRDYEIETKHIQQEQALVSGVLGAGSGAISGGIAGGLTKAGGAAGAAAGAAISVGTAVGGYFITGHYDRKSQEATDKLVSNQTSSVIMSGGGIAWNSIRGLPHEWAVIEMNRDYESQTELSDEQGELGYKTDCYLTSASTVISTGGGMQIEGLEVLNVGTRAANYISAIFARGVHID